jgi:hypothetical protein
MDAARPDGKGKFYQDKYLHMRYKTLMNGNNPLNAFA